MADQKISQLTALTALPATNDYFVVLDTSASATKKLAADYMFHTWVTNTPTVTASSGTFTEVSAGQRYFTLHGKTRVIEGIISIVAKGTAAGTVYATIPSGTPATLFGGSWPVSGRSTDGGINALLNVAESRLEFLKYDNTTLIADYKVINYCVIYELA